MGLTFKENCPDIRNTRVIDIINELKEYNVAVDVCDPWAAPADVEQEYGLNLVEYPVKQSYDGIVMAVAHQQFKQMGIEMIRSFGKAEHVLYDLKYLFSAEASDLRL